MSNDINVEPHPITSAIDELRLTIQSLEESISKDIDGSNNLETVYKFNEIKAGYDELLTSYEALALNNIQVTEESISEYVKVDAQLSDEIREQFA